MKFKSFKELKDQKGFTIVELLIVIVVIAILAAIVIVAYNGVQNRARDSNNRSDATSIVKVAEARNADRGSYATTVAQLNDGETSRVPSGVNINLVTATPTATPAAYVTTINDTRTYNVWLCANGANVYYPNRAGGTTDVVRAGQGCS